MTVVNPKSISGINSITMASGSDDLLTIHSNNTTERVRVDSSGNLTATGNLSIEGNTTLGNAVSDTITLSGRVNSDINPTGTTRDLGTTDYEWRNLYTTNGVIASDDIAVHASDTNTKIRFPAADTITAETSGSERLRIDSSGNLGLQQTSPSAALHIQDLSANGYELKLGGNQIKFNRTSLSYIDQVNDTGSLVFRTTSNDTERLRIASGGDVTVSTGNLIIGTAGKGIDFSAQTATSVGGASATAEILDHYEEGTWTPEYLNVTVTGYGHRSGTYTRIGRAVHCQFQISVDSGMDTSDTSAIAIGGLPFSGNSAHEACVFSFGKLTSILSNTRLAEVTNFRFGGNFIQLHRGSSYDLNYSFCNSSGHMQGAFTYQLS